MASIYQVTATTEGSRSTVRLPVLTGVMVDFQAKSVNRPFEYEHA